MTATARVPGLFGRLPGVIPVGLHELGHYAAGALPRPPSKVDVPAVSDWQVLGNDTKGDCGVAGLEHGFMADASITGQRESFPGSQDAISYYLRYTGGQDTGVVLSQYLAYVRKNGYYGHTVRAYAPIGVHDVPTLQFAIWAYGFAYTGIAVTEGMQQAFAEGKPWTTATLASNVLGGHCVPLVGYDDTYLYPVTWGRVQAVTYAAWHYMSDEAYAVISGELADGDGRGVSFAALEADLGKLAA